MTVVKRHPARALLQAAREKLGLDDVQVSEDAVFTLARAMEAQGRAWAESAFAAFREDNEERRQLRMRDLRRLTDDHVEVALEGDG